MQQTIDITWKEMTGGLQGAPGARPPGASILNFRNTITDQVIAAGGSLRYCVRWDSNGTVTASQRDQIPAALQRWINHWFRQLIGYDCWPYQEIPVTVTGWATRDRSRLAWTDNTVPVYVGMIRENAPECDQRCGRFFHKESGYQYPDCPGGFANHYDLSLWLTDGFGGGVGGDWGQRLRPEAVLGNLAAQSQVIVVHEMGHGLGFPDYYNWSTWAPGVQVPPTIMNAGASSVVTDWDTWMIRWTWSKIRSRF